MKYFYFLLVLVLLFAIFQPGLTRAEESTVNLSVQVLERKITDTMNDFTMDGVDYTEPAFKAVLGASTEASSTGNQSQNISPRFRWQNLLFLSTIYDVYYVIARFHP